VTDLNALAARTGALSVTTSAYGRRSRVQAACSGSTRIARVEPVRTADVATGGQDPLPAIPNSTTFGARAVARWRRKGFGACRGSYAREPTTRTGESGVKVLGDDVAGAGLIGTAVGAELVQADTTSTANAAETPARYRPSTSVTVVGRLGRRGGFNR
jgi:hypothetical protein